MVFSHRPARKNTTSPILSLLASGSLAALSTLALLPAHAATVTMKNGDRISGELRSLSGNTLTFTSVIFGKLSIPWNQVGELVSDDGVRIGLGNGSTIAGRITMDKAGTVTIEEPGGGGTRILSRGDLAALNPPVVDNATKYSGRLAAGGTFNRGNSSGEQLNVHGELVARKRKDRYTVGLDVNDASSGGVKTASSRRLLAQYDAFVGATNFLFVNGKAESDEPAGLKLRTALGGGYGHQFIDSEMSKLSGQVGLNYVREDYEIAPDRAFPTLSFGMKYDRSFFDKQLVYFHNLNVDLSLEDAQDAFLRTSLGLRVPVAHGISLSGQLNVDYDNLPAEGSKTTDTALIISVGYGF